MKPLLQIFCSILIPAILAISTCRYSVEAKSAHRDTQDRLAPESLWQSKKPVPTTAIVRQISGNRSATLLYKVSDQSDRIPEKALMYRYSEYKYGMPDAVRFFSKRLAAVIRETLGEEIAASPDDWVVVSPPYASLPSPSQALADAVARELGIHRVRLHVVQTQAPVVNFSALESKSAREEAAKAIDFFAKRPESLKGKKVLLLDDMINTGTTLASTSEKLIEKYKSPDVHLFGVISLDTDTPHLEEWANSLLLSANRLDKIVAILNDPNTIINKYAVARLLHADLQIQISILSQLTEEALQRFYDAVEHFYFGLGRRDALFEFQRFLEHVQSRTTFSWNRELSGPLKQNIAEQWLARFAEASGTQAIENLPWPGIRDTILKTLNGKTENIESYKPNAGMLIRTTTYDVVLLLHANGSWSWDIAHQPSERLILRRYLQISDDLSPEHREFFLQNRELISAIWISILDVFAARHKISDAEAFALYLLNNVTVGIPSSQLQELEKATADLFGRSHLFGPIDIGTKQPLDWQRITNNGVASYLRRAAGLTGFFRESRKWLPSLEQNLKIIIDEKLRSNNKEIRFLSIGSATGEEPYSLAAAIKLALIEYASHPAHGIPEPERSRWIESWKWEVIAADMDPASLIVAALGIFHSPFPEDKARPASETLIKYISPFFEERGGMIQALPSLRRGVRPMFSNFVHRADRDRLFEKPLDGIMKRYVSVHLTPAANIFVQAKIGRHIEQSERTWYCDDSHAVLAGKEASGPVRAVASIVDPRVYALAKILEEPEYAERIRIFLQSRGILPESRLAAERRVLEILSMTDLAQAQAALHSDERRRSFVEEIAKAFGSNLSDQDIMNIMILLRMPEEKITLHYPRSSLPWLGHDVPNAVAASL